MRALVTGGAGFIGSHVVDLLLQSGYSVRIFDNLELPTHAAGVPKYLSPAADFIRGDMRDLDAISGALQQVDVVVHLAATGGFTPRIAEYVAVNALGTANMLEVIRGHGLPVRKMVVASSIAVYGEGKYCCAQHGESCPPLRPISQMVKGEWEPACPTCNQPLQPALTCEETRVDPASPYAISKYATERLALNFGRETGIPIVALRYYVTYGPRQSAHNPYTGVCTIFSSRLLHGQPIVLYEDGQQTRDFIFVQDVAYATKMVLEDSRADFSVLNVGTGEAISIRRLAELLGECLDIKPRFDIPRRFRPAEVRHMVADISKLKQLGFQPQWSLQDGLREYVRWLREQAPPPESFGTAERQRLATGVVRNAN